MAEHRPYRVINASAQARLTQVKLVTVTGFMLLALLINWRVTELVARLFGYSRVLGRRPCSAFMRRGNGSSGGRAGTGPSSFSRCGNSASARPLIRYSYSLREPPA